MVKLIILVFTLDVKGPFEVHQFETHADCRYHSEIMIEQHQIKLPTQVFCCKVDGKCDVILRFSSYSIPSMIGSNKISDAGVILMPIISEKSIFCRPVKSTLSSARSLI